MFTAMFLFTYVLILLAGVVFVGATLHHHWKTFMDRKRAELKGDDAENGPDNELEGGDPGRFPRT